MTETVKVEAEIPQKLWRALSWYLRLTGFWISNDNEKESMNRLVVYALEGFLEIEADRPNLATDHIKRVLRQEFDILAET